VSILPVVERLTADGSGLAGEPGVSYLVRAGGARVLFDSGLSGKPESRWRETPGRCARARRIWTRW
jgi:hypothetical protein